MVDFNAIQNLAMEILTIVGRPLTSLLIAMLLLVVGLWIARIMQQATGYVLDAVGFDRITDAIGISKALKSGGVTRKTSHLAGDLVYWIVMLGALVTVASLYGLITPTALVALLFPYVATVVKAVLVFGIALFLAGIVGGFVHVVGSTAGLHYAKLLSSLARYSIIISSFVVVLSMLGIQTQWIIASMTFIVGSVAVAFAIAFGLGSKDMAGGFVAHLFKK